MSNDLLRRAFNYLKNYNDESVEYDTWQSQGLSDLVTEIENYLGEVDGGQVRHQEVPKASRQDNEAEEGKTNSSLEP